MRIIMDAGSTHGGDIELIKNLIDFACDISADVKLQMLEESQCRSGNIPFDHDQLPRIIDYGRKKSVNVFASCWSLDNMYTLRAAGATSVKFSYSSNPNPNMIAYAANEFYEVIYSCDHLSRRIHSKNQKNLLCIPQYPVYSKLDFSHKFDGFDGFSDHTLGTEQTFKAIDAGVRILEKHVICPDSEIDCPDARFACTHHEIEDIINYWELQEDKWMKY